MSGILYNDRSKIRVASGTHFSTFQNVSSGARNPSAAIMINDTEGPSLAPKSTNNHGVRSTTRARRESLLLNKYRMLLEADEEESLADEYDDDDDDSVVRNDDGVDIEMMFFNHSMSESLMLWLLSDGKNLPNVSVLLDRYLRLIQRIANPGT